LAPRDEECRRHSGLPDRQALGELAQSEGGTVVALLRHIGQQQELHRPAKTPPYATTAS
jgi:hypothetical protein